MPDLVLPKLGLTMTEGRLAEWRVGPGDRVRAGDVLFIVETDKIANEVEATEDGRIAEILVDAGETVPVGTILARWSSGTSNPLRPVGGEGGDPARSDGEGEVGGCDVGKRPGLPHLAPTLSAPEGRRGSDEPARRVIATPLARRLAKQRGIDLSAIRGSGPGGRIKAQDVAAARREAPASPTPIAGRRRAEPVESLAAARLAEAKATVPHFYLAATAEVTRLLALREDLAGDAAPPTITHFALAACARALAELPSANAIWQDGEILAFARVDLAIAVDTPRGLLVPVLRDAARLDLAGIARTVRDLVERARAGRLSPDDLGGGAVALSNLGAHGIDLVLPIINAPQAAILGLGRIREVFRPDARGAPALARELPLALSCDHRILDGVKGATLLRRIVSHLERPGRLISAPAIAGG